MSDNIQKLEKLAELRNKGILTEQEFQEQKENVLKQAQKELHSVNKNPQNYDNKKSKPNSKIDIQKILAGIILLAIIFFCIKSCDSPKNTSHKATVVVPTQKPVIKIDLESLSKKDQEVNQKSQLKPIKTDISTIIGDYNDNEIKANKKYKNKIAIISADFQTVQEHGNDFYVFIEDKNLSDALNVFWGAGFDVSKKYENYLSNLQKGQKVKFKCLIEGGEFMKVYLSDCEPVTK